MTALNPQNWNFIIQREDLYDVIGKVSVAEFCLYIYESPKLFQDDLRDNDCTRFQDKYCQDELEISQEQAFEKFGVPLDSWKQVE